MQCLAVVTAVGTMSVRVTSEVILIHVYYPDQWLLILTTPARSSYGERHRHTQPVIRSYHTYTLFTYRLPLTIGTSSSQWVDAAAQKGRDLSCDQ